MATAPPAELKVIAPYIQRANELAKADPVMSYWCLYYAAQLGIPIKTKEKESKVFLIGLMDRLEEVRTDDRADWYDQSSESS